MSKGLLGSVQLVDLCRGCCPRHIPIVVCQPV